MELRQLEYFAAVADEANFTRAAERIHVAQPAVSAQIARLERELGQVLFDRTRRQVRLTAAGEAVLPYARAALSAVANVRLAVDELAELVRGTVAIGTVTSHNVDLPSLLADFRGAHPAVEITLSTHNSDVLIDRLQTGTLDVAIVSVGSDEVPPGLAVEVVTDEAIEAVVSHDDPWADRTSVRLTTLVQRPLIALPVGAGIRAQLDNACAAAGLTPRIAVEASTPIALAEFAERGLGVAIVPQSVARSRAALHPIAISPALHGRLVLAWRASGPMSPAARALVAMARQLLRVGAGA